MRVSELTGYLTKQEVIRRLPKLVCEWIGDLPQLALARSKPPMDIYGFRMWMLPKWYQMTHRESKVWAKCYLPVQVKGMTVLDIGAGCGETAAFYLSHGARMVIAIEPDLFAFTLLKTNAKSLGGRIRPIWGFFEISHLSIRHDFLKMDAEGGEKELLKYTGELGPCAIEVHEEKYPGLAVKLAERFCLHQRAKMSNLTHILTCSKPI